MGRTGIYAWGERVSRNGYARPQCSSNQESPGFSYGECQGVPVDVNLTVEQLVDDLLQGHIKDNK